MDETTVRTIVKINFLVLALFLVVVVMSGIKKKGLGEQLISILGFKQPSQTGAVKATQ